MNLRVNINKIHADLLSNCEEVSIVEKSSLEIGEYVEISAIKESKELVMIISKRDLENNQFNWKYYSNPTKKDFLVERNSSVLNMINDVNDIFEKNRFDSEYIETIQ